MLHELEVHASVSNRKATLRRLDQIEVYFSNTRNLVGCGIGSLMLLGPPLMVSLGFGSKFAITADITEDSTPAESVPFTQKSKHFLRNFSISSRFTSYFQKRKKKKKKYAMWPLQSCGGWKQAYWGFLAPGVGQARENKAGNGSGVSQPSACHRLHAHLFLMDKKKIT